MTPIRVSPCSVTALVPGPCARAGRRYTQRVSDQGHAPNAVSLLEPATPYQRALLADVRGLIAAESIQLHAGGHGPAVCALVCDGSVAVGRVDPRRRATVVSLDGARELLEGYDDYLDELARPCPLGYIRVLCATLGDCVVLTMATGAWPGSARVGLA